MQVYFCSYTGTYLFSNFPLLVHEEFGSAFARMGNLAALKAKLQEVGYYGDGHMIVGAVIAPGVTVFLIAADMNVDYDVPLLTVQSPKASQMAIWFPGQSCLLRMLNNYVLLCIASGRCVFCFESYIFIPLHAARRAMAAALPLPLRTTAGFASDELAPS